MMVDTTVYGYVFDGYALHPDCVTSDDDIAAVDNGEASALYSHMDDDPEGLTCDDCGQYIFEPDYQTVLEDAVSDIIAAHHRGDIRSWGAARKVLDLFGDDEKLVEMFLENR